MADGLEGDARDRLGHLVGQEEHAPRDRHPMCARALLERAAMLRRRPLAMLGWARMRSEAQAARTRER
jgi:hypothetical protein